MAKPYKEGVGWAIRLRYKREEIYLSGFPNAAAASKAAAARQLAIDQIGRPTRLGPERTSLAVAFMDYARERLPFLKGARQDAQRISNYLRAGIEKMRIHSTRHQFADLVISSGRSLYDVQILLGHSDPRVSQRYARLSMHTLKEAANTASLIVPKLKAELKSDVPLPNGVVVPFQKVA